MTSSPGKGQVWQPWNPEDSLIKAARPGEITPGMAKS